MSNFPNSPGTIPTPPPQPGPPAPPFSGSSNRVACGVCGILLGGLGIHKFIYGATIPGVIMLVVTLVGGFFTCGIASAAMGVIGIIEGIMYLTKTDQEFYEIYQVGKKQWF